MENDPYQEAIDIVEYVRNSSYSLRRETSYMYTVLGDPDIIEEELRYRLSGEFEIYREGENFSFKPL